MTKRILKTVYSNLFRTSMRDVRLGKKVEFCNDFVSNDQIYLIGTRKGFGVKIGCYETSAVLWRHQNVKRCELIREDFF